MGKKKNGNKQRHFRELEGELYVKITDGNYSKIYENEAGLKDKKRLNIIFNDLKKKGVEFTEEHYDDGFW